VVRPISIRTVGVRPAAVRPAGMALAGVAVAALLAGCATHPVQSQEHSSIAGQNASVGPILIRDASIRLTSGGQGVLDVALYNSGADADSLTGVTSSAAAAITLPMGGTVALPPQAGVFLNTPPDEIMLGALTGSPLPGQSLPVTLTFAKAGTLNLVVPVLAGDSGSASASPTTASSSAPAA
jgi:copper(I)-binding protein